MYHRPDVPQCFDMSDNDGHDSIQQPAPGSREAGTRNASWFSGPQANDFIFNRPQMNDAARDLNINTISDNRAITISQLVMNNYHAQSAPQAEQADARGRTDNHWWSYHLHVLSAEPHQSTYRPQDDYAPRAPQNLPVQESPSW